MTWIKVGLYIGQSKMITQDTEFAILQDEKTQMTRLYKKGHGWSDPLPTTDWEVLSTLHQVMRESEPSDFLQNMGIIVKNIKREE